MPFHVMIWPKSAAARTQHELYAFNLDEETLRERFIEPYELDEPIAWSGRTLDGGDITSLRISETAGPLDERAVRASFQEYEAFESGREVTNDWVVRPAGSRARNQVVPESDALRTVERLCRRFGVVARQLQRRHQSRATLQINDEYDVQDLMHALLLVEFEDVRAESWNPTYLGGGSRIDFLVRDSGIIVEVKKTRATLGDREVGGELAEDVTRYSDPGANRGASTLVCFVYDPEHHLGNPAGLERDLNDASNERLQVVGIVG